MPGGNQSALTEEWSGTSNVTKTISYRLIMTTYKEIRGTQIESSNIRSTSNPINGQMWYNSTEVTNVLKGSSSYVLLELGLQVEINTGRQSGWSAGTQTSALGFGGGPTLQHLEQ